MQLVAPAGDWTGTQARSDTAKMKTHVLSLKKSFSRKVCPVDQIPPLEKCWPVSQAELASPSICLVCHSGARACPYKEEQTLRQVMLPISLLRINAGLLRRPTQYTTEVPWRWIPSTTRLFPVLSAGTIANTIGFTVTQWNSLRPHLWGQGLGWNLRLTGDFYGCRDRL